jgi:hypothetical protein
MPGTPEKKKKKKKKNRTRARGYRGGKVDENDGTYGNSCRDKITFVQDKDQVLVRCLFANVFFNTAATGTLGITRIKDVDNDIGRINDFVKLVPDTLTLSLGEDRFTSSGELAEIFLSVVITADDGATISVGAFVVLLDVGILHLGSLASEVLERGHAELHTLALSLRTEGIPEWISLNSHLGLVLLQTVDSTIVIPDQAHGQLIGLEENLVRVGSTLGDSLTERGQSLLGDNTGVAEPFTVGLDPSCGLISGLVACSDCDVSFLVTTRLAILEHVQGLDLLGIAEENVSHWPRLGVKLNIPVEIFTFGFDIGHAITSLPLPLFTSGLLLSCTHGEGWKMKRDEKK